MLTIFRALCSLIASQICAWLCFVSALTSYGLLRVTSVCCVLPVFFCSGRVHIHAWDLPCADCVVRSLPSLVATACLHLQQLLFQGGLGCSCSYFENFSEFARMDEFARIWCACLRVSFFIPCLHNPVLSCFFVRLPAVGMACVSNA